MSTYFGLVEHVKTILSDAKRIDKIKVERIGLKKHISVVISLGREFKLTSQSTWCKMSKDCSFTETKDLPKIF